MDIDSLEQDTIYYIYPYAKSMWGMYAIGDVFACKTAGIQDIPIWLIAILIIIAALGIYTKSILLSIVGIVIAVVTNIWIRSANIEEVTLWGASAFLLIIIVWLIFSMIYTSHKKEAKL